jgi:hypothetical protein
MIKKILLSVIFIIIVSLWIYPVAHALQSTITESEGYSCMGNDKSRKQTETEALADAKRKAVDNASTYIRSETHVKDLQLEKDLIDAYANATITIVQELGKSWYNDQMSGDCFKIKIKAEVIPDDKAMASISKGSGTSDDPNTPLYVQLWTEKKEYKRSEKIKIYMKGNKPFYVRVLYKDVKGNILQLLPNPYRNDNYFNGGVIYEIPSGRDNFELVVNPPFGEESIIFYASPSQLGEISLSDAGGVYQVKTGMKDIGISTRGIKIKEKSDDKVAPVSEFYEGKLNIKTEK